MLRAILSALSPIVSEVNKTAHPVAWTLLLVYRILILLAWLCTPIVNRYISLIIRLIISSTMKRTLILAMGEVIFAQLLLSTLIAPFWILPARLFACRPMNKIEWAFLIPCIQILCFFFWIEYVSL